MTIYLYQLLLIFFAVRSCLCAIFENADDIPVSLSIDYIVVGGGTAGSVVANRLTEDNNITVLVLEAGGSNANLLLSEVPAFCGQTVGSQLDWNYTALVGQLNRTVEYARGFVLGGSSSINCMAYTRGSAEDWDRYAEVTGDPGWSWDSVQQYIRKNEHFTLPVDGHDITGEFDPAVHGFSGINSVSLSGFQTELDRRVIQASKGMQNEFRFNLDYNNGRNQLGIGFAQSTVLNGTRSSSATSYLAPRFVNRPNLLVLLNAHVTRVSSVTRNPIFLNAVDVTQDGGATSRRLHSQREVIISAGSIGTPQLLMLSGIGDEATLTNLGIRPLVHSPSVGQNLSEQVAVQSTWAVNSTDTADTAGRDPQLAAEQLQEWKEARMGPLVNAPLLDVGWIRIPSNSSIFDRFEDPAAGPNTAHWEFQFINGFVGPPAPSGNFITASPVLVSPASRGSVTLNSSNPFVHPIINLGLLNSDFDVFVLREALKSVNSFMKSPAFDGYILSSTLNATTDEELEEYIRTTGGPVLHSVGTASMSPVGSSWGVVTPDLRVKGTQGLRIVDASVLPFVPASHTQAPVYTLSERAADLIKAYWA